MKVFIFILFISSFFLTVQSAQEDHLNNLFKQLEKTHNSKSAELLEKKIWSVWNIHPNNIRLTERLEFGIELMQYKNYYYALKIFNNILLTDPEWSEAWNKRATVYFLMGKFTNSLNDIEKVLQLEPRHFGALSGQAQIYIKLHEYEKAIKSLETALEFYPSFRSGELIFKIKKMILEESI